MSMVEASVTMLGRVTFMTRVPVADIRTGGFLHCANCGRRIGQLVGEQVMIEDGGRRLFCSALAHPMIPCPRCSRENAVLLE